MQVDPDFAQLIHPDASALLRPRTGLQDMTIELDAGTEEGEIPEGFTIPLANSEPNINTDQILASLDGDTRAYLRLLLAGGAQALGSKEKSQNFSNVLRRLEPTTRDIAKINGAIAKRRDNLRHVITNFKLIAEELAKSDTNLTGFVESQSKVFGAFADSQANLRQTLQELPGALQATRGALGASATLSSELKPALTDLIPQAKALGPALRATRPFFRKTTPSLRDQVRPFTRNVSGVVGDLKRAAKPLEQVVRPAERRADRAQPGLQRARLQPERQRRELPLLPELAEPQHELRLPDPGRPRPDPPRPAHLHLPRLAPRRRPRRRPARGEDGPPAGPAADERGAQLLLHRQGAAGPSPIPGASSGDEDTTTTDSTPRTRRRPTRRRPIRPRPRPRRPIPRPPTTTADSGDPATGDTTATP